jgi:TRAP-type C4-dicarboxylate transport system substrate-binding protein
MHSLRISSRVDRAGYLVRSILAGALVVTATSVSAQTRLLLSTFFPPAHPIYSQVMQPWAQEVEKATGGAVKIDFSPNSLAPPPGQMDLVAKGGADISFQFAGVVPNRLTTTLVTEVPGPTSSALAMSTALWRTHEKFFAAAGEHKGLKVLGVVAFPAQGFFSLSDPIVSIDQLKRTKVAATPGNAAKSFGAVTTGVVAGPAVRYFELVSKGMVDAYVSVTPIDVMSFNLSRYTKGWTQFEGLGTAGSFTFFINESRWNALPAAAREAIARLSGEAFSARMGVLDQANNGAIKALVDQGVKVVKAPAAFEAELREAFNIIEQEWLAEVAKRGVDGRAALAFYRAEQARAATSR